MAGTTGTSMGYDCTACQVSVDLFHLQYCI